MKLLQGRTKNRHFSNILNKIGKKIERYLIYKFTKPKEGVHDLSLARMYKKWLIFERHYDNHDFKKVWIKTRELVHYLHRPCPGIPVRVSCSGWLHPSRAPAPP